MTHVFFRNYLPHRHIVVNNGISPALILLPWPPNSKLRRKREPQSRQHLRAIRNHFRVLGQHIRWAGGEAKEIAAEDVEPNAKFVRFCSRNHELAPLQVFQIGPIL